MTHQKHIQDDFIISTDKSKLQIDTICDFLSRTHWAANRKRDVVIKSIENSLCYGLYHNTLQIGFARVVTDLSTYAYLCDVIIAENYRGRGLSKWLIACIMQHPDLANLRRFTLATKDAHGLYKKFGFNSLSQEEIRRFMSILKEGV